MQKKTEASNARDMRVERGASASALPISAARRAEGMRRPMVSNDKLSAAPYHICCGACTVMERTTAVRLTLCCIFVTLCAKESGNVSLPSTLPVLVSRFEGPVDTLLPTAGTAFYAAGKLSVALFAQAVGTKAVLVSTTCLAGVGLLACAFASGYFGMLVGWCLAQFACGHVWVACFGLTAAWIDRAYQGRVLGIVFAIGSDGGGALGSFVFSQLLRAGGASWRLAFLLAGALLLGASAALALSLRRSAEAAGFAPPDLSDAPSRHTRSAHARTRE